MQVIENFKSALMDRGIVPPVDIIGDGKIHRADVEGKNGKNDASYQLHLDAHPAGWFENHRDGLGQQNWSAGSSTPITPIQREERAAKVAARAIDLAAAQNTASKTAAALWESAKEATADNPYCKSKGISPHGLREFTDTRTLIVPVRDAAGSITSLQFIDADGSKKFKSSGKIEGGYYSFGGKPTDTVLICEGFATGASLHQATGHPIAVAFNAGNLEAVAKVLRAKLPDTRLILCADNDRFTGSGNTGITSATKAAAAVSGFVAIPIFKSDDGQPTDYNDLHQIEGIEAVKLAIAGVTNTAFMGTPKQRQPEPLPEMPNVAPFDYDYLPGALRGYVKDISERMQCPPDFAAVSVFVMMATLIGRKVGIRPMRHDDWTVIVNLWGAVVGSSGVMKSPTMSAALSPLKKIQSAAFEEYNNLKADYDAQAELLKLQVSVNKSNAKKALKANNTDEARGAMKISAIDEAPMLKRFITNNASYEALGELLMENPNGLLVEADEIIGLLKSLDAEGQQVARSFYLTAADGDKGYTFDRIMRGKGLHIDAVCLSVIGGIQPGVLAEYVRQAVAGGAGADGLLQRFALMVYPDISPTWREVDRYPDSEAREVVNQLADRVEFLNPDRLAAETGKYGGVPFLRFDDAAQRLFSEWRGNLEGRLRSGDEHPAFVSHLSKYRKLIPSLALINHICDSAGGPVTEEALLRAIAFSEYLESHARRIYSFGTRPDIESAKSLLKRINAGKLSGQFSLRDVYRACWTGLETPAKAQSAVNVLMEYGHLIEESINTGGRPTVHYTINRGAV